MFLILLTAWIAVTGFSQDLDVSTVETQGPPAPVGLNATWGVEGLTLTWVPDGETVHSYMVFRSTIGVSDYLLLASDLIRPEYLDTSLVEGQRYFYIVVSVDSSGRVSPNSELLMVRIQPGETVPETGLPLIQTETSGKLTISSAEVGCTVKNDGGDTPQVILYFGKTDGGTRPEEWDTSVDLGLQHEGSVAITLHDLEPGTEYFYTVQAGNRAGTTWGKTDAFVTPRYRSPNLRGTYVRYVSSLEWLTVELGQTYHSPVILTTPILPSGDHPPVVTRIRNVTADSFEISVDRLDRSYMPVMVDVSVITVEEGVYTKEDIGVNMEAVKFVSNRTSGTGHWQAEPRNYVNTYTDPVVLGQVMSSVDPHWSSFYATGSHTTDAPDESNVWVGKHIGEDPRTERKNEIIGYLVIESGCGEIGGVTYTAGLIPDVIQGPENSHTGYRVEHAGLADARAAVISSAGMDDEDGALPTLVGPDPFSGEYLRLVVDEDMLLDNERAHSTERAAYLILE